MDKERVVKELDDYVKRLNTRLSVIKDSDGYLVLNYDNSCQAWFRKFNADDFDFDVDDELRMLFAKKGYLTDFYRGAVRLMNRYDTKYTIQVFPDKYGFLARRYLNGFNDGSSLDVFDTGCFTLREIEQLKKRDDIAIDWDKAIIKEVTNNDESNN